MNIKTKQVKTIDLTPSWEAAVRIYCAVLQNPKADPNAKWNAEQDLLKLAQSMDKVISDNKKSIASLGEKS